MTRAFLRGLRATCGAACVATCLTFATLAHATSFSTNYSDLWWNPDEPGWGLNVSQQADVLFVTTFVYNAQGQPVWYAGTLTYVGEDITGSRTWSGDLYSTNGSPFLSPYDPRMFVTHKVGVANFASNANDTAIFQFVQPMSVATKTVQRQTLVSNNLAGSYLGATSDVSVKCLNPANNGRRTDDVGAIAITHTGSAVTIKTPGCSYGGSYFQFGQVGSVSGKYTCDNGAEGPINIYDVRVEQSGLIARYTGTSGSCQFVGSIGAARTP